MDITTIVTQLTRQAEAIYALASLTGDEQARWRPTPGDWSLLEVIHHLLDEEVEDFRTHFDHILFHASDPWPRIDTQSWVTARRYNERSLQDVLARFIDERHASLRWLTSLEAADLDAAVPAPWGALRAGDLLAAWAAHDLLHLRQLVELHFAWTGRASAPYLLDYAGDW